MLELRSQRHFLSFLLFHNIPKSQLSTKLQTYNLFLPLCVFLFCILFCFCIQRAEIRNQHRNVNHNICVIFFLHIKVSIFRKLGKVSFFLMSYYFKCILLQLLPFFPPQILTITTAVKCLSVFRVVDCFFRGLNSLKKSHHYPL